MRFVKYTGFTEDGDEQIEGFAFLYEDQRLAYAVETVIDNKNRQKEHEQRDALDQFKHAICQVLYALKRGRSPQGVPLKGVLKYC